MHDKLKFNDFSSQDELVQQLGNRICSQLEQAILERDRALLVLSGGSTPKPLFEYLSQMDIAWEKVFITLADDRWVEADHRDSNERLVRSILLQDMASSAIFTGLKTAAPTAKEGEHLCSLRITMLQRPFDVVVLGMGTDGHTASLFPGAPELKEAVRQDSKRDCLAITPPSTTHSRMTLTLPTLLDSRQIFIHIEGDDKKKAYEKALLKDSQGNPMPPEEMPVRYFLYQQKTPVSVYWSP